MDTVRVLRGRTYRELGLKRKRRDIWSRALDARTASDKCKGWRSCRKALIAERFTVLFFGILSLKVAGYLAQGVGRQNRKR